MWPVNEHGEIIAIDDSEMARINIEITSAFAHWLTLLHTDPALFRKLVKTVVEILPPFPFRLITFDMEEYKKQFRLLTSYNSKSGREDYLAFLQKTLQEKFGDAADLYLQRKRERFSGNFMRILANDIVCKTYRNGPIENAHAGVGENRRYLPRPLTQRRIAPYAEYEVLKTTANQLFPILHALYRVIMKETGETLDEKLFPYSIRFDQELHTDNWSLTEETRMVEIPDGEPEK
jgi:hypothetical protein